MSGLEICLVVIGIVMIAISYIFSERFGANSAETELLKDGKFSEVAKEIIKKEVEAELAMIVDDKLEEAKKDMTKISSEQILQMGNYSDDINLRISKNHEEVMFLYNMLNDKETVVKNTIKDIEALKVSVKKMAIVNEMATDVVVKDENAVQIASVSDKETQVDRNNEDLKQEAPVEVPEIQPIIEKKSRVNLKTSNNNKKILELYSQGMTNIQIAKKLGLGVGEVRLVIDLYNSKK